MASRSFQYFLVSFLVVLVLSAKPGLGTTVRKLLGVQRGRNKLSFTSNMALSMIIAFSLLGEMNKTKEIVADGEESTVASDQVTSSSFIFLPRQLNLMVWIPMPPLLASLTKMQHLNLSHANFTGSLPSQLGNLSNLLSLDLSLNDDLHSGNLECLSHLSSLRLLDLSILPPLTTPSLSHVNSSAPLAFLDLSDNYDLASSVYPWVFNFSTTLVHLSISQGNLNCLIPGAYGNMISLAYLDLRACALKGEIPESFGNMSSLTYLDLSENQLQGAIPKAFGNMRSLKYLDLSKNQLQGSIPNTVGNLASLERLYLLVNRLRGSIPEVVGNMTSLTELHLSSNRLHGSIPEALGNMSSLKYLDLSSNQLQGSIPDTVGTCLLLNDSILGSISDEFGNMTSLTELHLSQNQLQGSIPNTVGNMISLEVLYLPDNQLQGSIPDTIGSMVSLQVLSLHWNQLQGSIPDRVGSMVSLQVLSLHGNQLQGSIPDTVGNLTFLEELYLDENKLEGEIPKSLGNLCSLQVLDLHSNNLSGQLPQDFLACANDTLERLFLFDNQLRGSVPHVTGFSSLQVLSLGLNQLNGTLPKSIGHLATLSELDIRSNSLQGAISEAHLFNLSELFLLDLSSSSLTFNISLEWVPPFQLSYLLLASSKLGPRFLCWLRTQKYLMEIDISNSEISDAIPDWFWNLTSIANTFNISNNQITGTLPNLSSNFDYPLYIDMSSNFLESSIPRLPSSLSLLDLSNNKFSGSISTLCAVSSPYLASPS
ncbi:LRR receptor-like serine/threonine-protein kinase GSO1 [Vitis vinifera]|uniref:LRR receptor-like serine/threonine-protein kinase GSO1 n=1 Tax=Vitis vinifera TaxID=29760 RepID=A0A438IN52_VITVI|nr:LRR receptor-like serine/threonine-protein kinase GSO1 [Vitis vinifera]